MKRWMLTLMTAVALAGAAHAADALPEAPKPKPVHRFMDKTNMAVFAGLAAGLSVDGKTTRDIMGSPWARPHENNPISRPFVHSDRAMAGYMLASYAGDVAVMGLLHKKGHHKTERILGFSLMAVEGYCVSSNFRTKGRFGL